jgi:hypothetical protein
MPSAPHPTATSPAALAQLAELARPFRRDYLDYATIAEQLHAWAAAYPELARVRSIGTTLEGRELLLLTIGRDPDRRRPAVWIDANMHATEVCGSSVALAIAEDVLRLHLEPTLEASVQSATSGGAGQSPLHGLPPHVRARLRDVVFHVLPRVCPDGAETVLRHGRYVRSNPRDRRETTRPRWIAGDVDGDGLALVMRKRDPAGEYVESLDVPGLMLPRRLEDEGPYFKLFPEGVVEPWDGVTIPDPHFLSDNDTDLNRNFPFRWMPEPEQVGAGRYPASEPETRAVVEFVSAHPEIFAWLNLHTFGGVYIRPLGTASDKKMDPEDLAIFRQVAEWGETYGGYPTVSGFEEFTYEPDKPLHGDLCDFAYHQRGCIAYVCELWDLFAQLGIPRKKPFVDHYSLLTRDDLVRLGQWDVQHNQRRLVRPWRACTHPQLGEVEVGGLDSRVGISNPPYELVAEICARQSAAFLRVAAMTPALAITAVEITRLEGGARRVDVTLENTGYLPTNVLSSSKSLPWNEPVVAVATPRGCALAEPSSARRELGHLDGWGRGLHGAGSSIFHQRSRGSVSIRRVSWTVTGVGALAVTATGPRIGTVERTIDLG